MKNFEFCVGTDIIFGKDSEKQLSEKLKPFGKRILMVYGKGSIKKNGIYEKVKNALDDFTVFELEGIKANPTLEKVVKGANICREKNIDIVLAVGGGSCIDSAKAIAAASCYEGAAWDIICGKAEIKNALHVACVLTLSATGSEMDAGAVITNESINEKRGFGSPLLLPKVSILNPENTYTVSAYQTASGSSDIIAHIIENYFDKEDLFLQDRFAEALVKTVVKYTKIAINEPDNYEARGQLMWASSWAINGILSTGKSDGWSIHSIEHELSAYYDIPHGVGLAIILPQWMKYILSDTTVKKMSEFFHNAMDIPKSKDLFKTANAGIDKMKEFFVEIGIPRRLSEMGIIDRSRFETMAKRAVEIGQLHTAYVPLDWRDVCNIYEMCF